MASLYAQDIDYAKKTISTLSSEGFHGRGYVKQGDKKAAKFIKGEFEKTGLKAFNNSFYQYFDMSINTFPSRMSLSIDGKELSAGKEFMVNCGSKGLKGDFTIKSISSFPPENDGEQKILEEAGPDDIILIREKWESPGLINPYKCAGYIILKDRKLFWHVSSGRNPLDYIFLEVQKTAFNGEARTASINIKNKFREGYRTANIIGFLEGSSQPDSFLVVCAHYDHLGHMGNEAFFPGAHDNASGVAMMLDLAGYFSQKENQLPESIAFMAFSGEEAGLLGSSYYVNNPLFPLENIKFVLNLDLMGSGSQGITFVNADAEPRAFKLMGKINEENEFIRKVAYRKNSCNSDHCPFYNAGVPAAFLYTNGDEYTEYHTVTDRAEGLPLTEYEDIVRLLIRFMQKY